MALEWVTTLETNINNLVVERSDNMLNFTDLDTVAAVNNGRFTHTYTYEDGAPLQTLSYYRLRITDNDGVTSYSAPVSISLITSTQSVLDEIPPTVYANPSQEGCYPCQTRKQPH